VRRIVNPNQEAAMNPLSLRHAAVALLWITAVAAPLAGCGAIDDPNSQTFNEESAGNGSTPQLCSSASGAVNQCPHPNICALCSPGRGPACASSQCYEGHCDVIEPCSGVACKSAADCPHSNICALCSPGRVPSCATSECINGWCHDIAPCSL
jgi:hypothetical protein